jgi:hypothetical protein
LVKAGRQLKRSIAAVSDNYSQVCDWLEIDKPFDKLNVVPLIVSSSFEYDHQFFDGFQKVSLFELQLLLQGTTPILKAWLKMKGVALETLSTDLYDKLSTGYASEDDWSRLKESMSTVSIDGGIDKIINDGTLKTVSREASAENVADAIQTGAVWSQLIQEPLLDPEELVPLTIDGKVIANFAA